MEVSLTNHTASSYGAPHIPSTSSASHLERCTVDLSSYPDLVVVYLGLRVNAWNGLRRLLRLGPGIQASVAAQPDGLLSHENLTYGLFPLHIGMRQYWRDFDSLERFTRSEPHRTWWREFLRDAGGTGFWHETYARRGGMEAIYDDVPVRVGFARFAPVVAAEGRRASARGRLSGANDEEHQSSSPSARQ